MPDRFAAGKRAQEGLDVGCVLVGYDVVAAKGLPRPMLGRIACALLRCARRREKISIVL
jgi:hypothetical protein